MDKEQIIEKLWEDAGHGTRREDIESAYAAGVTAERERCAKLCEDIQAKAKQWGPMAGYCAETIRGPNVNVNRLVVVGWHLG